MVISAYTLWWQSVLGNSKILQNLIGSFDGITWLMQIAIFFILGLLAFLKIPSVALPAILISVFMIIVARPVATFLILSWFKTPVRQQLLVSWSGLRGAASIVFAIFVMASAID